MSLQLIPRDNSKDRVETGPVQFGDDWPGIFIRGDNSIAYAFALSTYLRNPLDVFARMQLIGLSKLFLECNLCEVDKADVLDSIDKLALPPGE